MTWWISPTMTDDNVTNLRIVSSNDEPEDISEDLPPAAHVASVLVDQPLKEALACGFTEEGNFVIITSQEMTYRNALWLLAAAQRYVTQ